MTEEARSAAVGGAQRILLHLIGTEGFKNEGVRRTPERLVAALEELTAGYRMDPKEILTRRFDADGYDEVVALSNIRFVSLCEHHVLPFEGRAGVAYLPSNRVVGLSKLARLVDCFARRLQMQERMTKQIADALATHLEPRGIAVLVEGSHTCMTHRGVGKIGSVMKTSDVRGVFRDKPEARAEVFALLK
jgi:GTP cyclohydrolase I